MDSRGVPEIKTKKAVPTYTESAHAASNTIFKRNDQYPISKQFKLEQALQMTRRGVSVSRPDFYKIVGEQLRDKKPKVTSPKNKILRT